MCKKEKSAAKKNQYEEFQRRRREYRDIIKSHDEMRSLLREIFDYGEFYPGAIERKDFDAWSDDLGNRVKSAIDTADKLRPVEEKDPEA